MERVFFFKVGDETESTLEELLTLGRCNDEDARMGEKVKHSIRDFE
jgi:hypothetical protein